MNSTSFDNPQHSNHQDELAQTIMMKSFLKSRDSLRQTGKGSTFFSDNKIRSCSFVKENKNGQLTAIPFYDKRKHSHSQGLSSSVTNGLKSWQSTVFERPQSYNAGMGSKKPLTKYNPNHSRNLLTVKSYIPPSPNNSAQIHIGSRDKKDSKHYVTNYGNVNAFVHESQRIPSNNPAIQAYRHKWIKSRLDK